jgi:hypothetical protein
MTNKKYRIMINEKSQLADPKELIPLEVLHHTAKWTQFGLVSSSRSSDSQLLLLSDTTSSSKSLPVLGNSHSKGESLKLKDLFTIDLLRNYDDVANFSS